MKRESKIFVAGHRGMVGSALVRALHRNDYPYLLLRTRAELDLLNSEAVETFFREARPNVVLLAAAKVGGILANDTYPVEFLLENLTIQNNVISSAHRNGVEKLLFLGSSCIYPKLCPQPIKEEYLLSGELEPTNEPYALAKIAGIKLCQAYHREYGANFISSMPTNLYGPHDNFDLVSSHVMPALIRKMHEAKEDGKTNVEIWGDGSPRREFLHVDDLADACLFLLQNYNKPGIVNIGTGKDLTIRDLAERVRSLVGYEGQLTFNASQPNGTPRKLLDVTYLSSLGWTAKIDLEEGIRDTYEWYRRHRESS